VFAPGHPEAVSKYCRRYYFIFRSDEHRLIPLLQRAESYLISEEIDVEEEERKLWRTVYTIMV
jgi:hypothetical protein